MTGETPQSWAARFNPLYALVAGAATSPTFLRPLLLSRATTRATTKQAAHVLAPVITDAVPFSVAFGAAKLEQISQAITANGGPNRHGEGSWSATQFTGVIAPSSTASSSPVMAVRRLTPRECERLQGFPDDYTIVPWRGEPCPDGPRYKALGNSMAVPVMRWIGRRIDEKLRERP